MGSGAALGINSVPVATAVGTAGAAAGVAGAVYGISKGVGQIQDGKTGVGVTNIAGGAAAGVGAGLLMASNPAGWVALAVGGIAMVGASMWEAAHNYELAGESVEKEFNAVSQSLHKEAMKKEEYLLDIQESLRSEEDLEETRKKLVESGLLSEKDMQKAQKMSREELEKLTQQYINTTKAMSNEEQELLEQIKSDKVAEANSASASIKDWFENDFKKNNNNENNEIARNLIVNMADTLNAKGSSNWSKEESKFMERYNKNNNDGKWGYDDMKWVLEGGGSWWGISDAVMSNTTDLLTNTGFANYARSRGKNILNYNAVDPALVPYISSINQATTDEEMAIAVDSAKNAGVVYSDWEKYINNKHGIAVPSFRVGTNRIPYDNYPALLHEGEAVLTASTANELRGLIDEYRETRNDSARISQAIENQTNVLVARLDAIYAKMPSSEEVQAQEIMPGRLNQNARNMTTPFNIF